MSDEELTAVQEELAEARVELERLQVGAADSEARAAQLEAQEAELRHELAQANHEAEAREQELAGLREQTKSSAERYRELVLQQAPELPAELVTGETVEEIDVALERARETVSKVRGHLESQAQAGRVPVGAPARSGPDLSALSPEEKIRFGLNQSSG